MVSSLGQIRVTVVEKTGRKTRLKIESDQRVGLFNEAQKCRCLMMEINMARTLQTTSDPKTGETLGWRSLCEHHGRVVFQQTMMGKAKATPTPRSTSAMTCPSRPVTKSPTVYTPN